MINLLKKSNFLASTDLKDIFERKKYVDLWFLIGLVIFISSFYLFPTENARKTTFYLMVALPFIFSIMKYPFSRKKLDLEGQYLLFVYIFYLTLTGLWGDGYSSDSFWQSCKVFLCLVAFYTSIRVWVFYNKHDFYLFYLLCLIALFSAIVIFLNHDLGFSFNKFRFLPDSDYYGNANKAGKVFGFATVVAIGLTFCLKSKVRYLFLFCSVVGSLLVYSTKSSSAFLSLLLLIPITVFLFSERKKSILIAFTIVFFVFCVVYKLGLLDRFFVDGMSKRDLIWQSVAQEVYENPIWGSGNQHDTRVIAADGRTYAHSHNMTMSIARYSGSVGVILFLATSLVVYKVGIVSDNGKLWLALYLYGLISLASSAKYPLYRPNEVWLLYWLPLLMLFSRRSSAVNK